MNKATTQHVQSNPVHTIVEKKYNSSFYESRKII